jgi:hypothetical protein
MSELRAEQDEARAVGGTSEHKKVDVELNEMTSAWQLMQEKAMKLKCQLEREKQSLAAEKAHLDTEKKVRVNTTNHSPPSTSTSSWASSSCLYSMRRISSLISA